MAFDNALVNQVDAFATNRGLFDTDNLIVGVSGGPDSMALISILHKLSSNENFPRIYAVHVKHNIRPECNEDYEIAREYCDSIGVPLKLYEFDVVNEARTIGRSLEETGRILRYKAFDDYARELCGESYKENSRIVVAHHRDDLAETMMMNLFRGSGLEGMVSPEAINGRIIRPLLFCEKSELVAYLKERNINFAIDQTNYETTCTRNVWRNELLPAITEHSNKNANEALASTYELLAEDLDYITQEVNLAYEKVIVRLRNQLFVNASEIKSLHPAIATRIARRLWLDTFGNLTDLAKTHVDAALQLWTSEVASQTSIDLSFGRKAFIANGYAGFCDEAKLVTAMCDIARLMGLVVAENHFEVELSKNTKLPIRDLQIDVQIVENSGVWEYNTNSWFYPLCEPGDEKIKLVTGALNLKFKRAGSSGSKTLKDILSDMKVPKSAREFVVTAVKDNQILWIPGVGHAVGFTGDKSYKAWCEDSSHSDKANCFIKVSI